MPNDHRFNNWLISGITTSMCRNTNILDKTKAIKQIGASRKESISSLGGKGKRKDERLYRSRSFTLI